MDATSFVALAIHVNESGVNGSVPSMVRDPNDFWYIVFPVVRKGVSNDHDFYDAGRTFTFAVYGDKCSAVHGSAPWFGVLFQNFVELHFRH